MTMFVPKPDGGNFTPPPAGNHIAICYRFIDLGTQTVEWKGAKKNQRKVLISWELPNELMTEGDYAGQPFTIGRRYTWSMSEKANLRHDLESWRGRSFTDDDFSGPNRFNVKNIIGKACMLSIVHETKDGSTYANIKSVAAMPKGMQAPEPVNKAIYFTLEKDGFDNAILDGLSDKLKETIKGSPEYRELVDASYKKPSNNIELSALDDDIPF
jgi:hypothetical protein